MSLLLQLTDTASYAVSSFQSVSSSYANVVSTTNSSSYALTSSYSPTIGISGPFNICLSGSSGIYTAVFNFVNGIVVSTSSIDINDKLIFTGGPSISLIITSPTGSFDQSSMGWTSVSAVNCPNLSELVVSSNNLTVLNVNGSTALNTLICIGNLLTILDVSTNSLLAILECNENNLTTLDVSNHTQLTGLYCDSNQITSLNITNNTTLTVLSCPSNRLATLDISTNSSLLQLYASGNQFTQTAVDAILANLVSFNLTGGLLQLQGGTSSTPSSTGLTNAATLISRGWSVSHN